MESADLEKLASSIQLGTLTVIASRPFERLFLSDLLQLTNFRFTSTTVVTSSPHDTGWPNLAIVAHQNWAQLGWQTYVPASGVTIFHPVPVSVLPDIAESRNPETAYVAIVHLPPEIEDRVSKRPVQSDFEDILANADSVWTVYYDSIYGPGPGPFLDREVLRVA
jgi:hypothetical protein